MITRDELLAAIDQVYAHRIKGDVPAIMSLTAPNVTFRIAGVQTNLHGVNIGGDLPVQQTVQALAETFRFHSIERVTTVVEGPTAAILLRAEISHNNQPPVTTEIFDLWTADESGKLTSLTQFVDTALIERLVRPSAPHTP